MATGQAGSRATLVKAAGLAVATAFVGLTAAVAWLMIPTQQEYTVSLDRGLEQKLVINLQESQPVLTVLVPNKTARIERLFSDLSYELRTIRMGRSEVPRVFLTSVPEDLGRIRNLRARKSMFLRMVLPLTLKVNEEVRQVRERINDLMLQRQAGIDLGSDSTAWLRMIADQYRVGSVDMRVMLRRIDEVPVSLVIAQAIEESGWGTSRFAREGNALFGQYTWSDEADGIVPGERPEGERHRIRAFETLIDAIRAYVHNLNSHRAYREFRDLRSALRRQDETLSGLVLAGTLTKYSERGADYVAAIRNLMISERLTPFDTAGLAEQDDTQLVHLVSAEELAGAYGPGT